MQAFLDELDLLIRARYTALYVLTSEEQRLEDLLFGLARRQGKKLLSWTAQRGLYEYRGYHEPGKGIEKLRAPDAVLGEIQRGAGPALYLLKDLHRHFDQPAVVRQLRDLAADLKQTFKTLILSAPRMDLPAELEKDLMVLDLPLPGESELRELLGTVCTELRRQDGDAVALDEAGSADLVRAARGLTLAEAENAFAKAAVSRGVLDAGDAALISAEKQQLIRKSGILEYHPPGATLSDVGGLANLKRWLARRGLAWRADAASFGLPAPKGVLLLGVPGCGKSLTARAVAQAWRLPLLHLDLGRVFAGILGSSEENMRRALKVAEGVAPAVLWIDEIEKGLAGATGGAERDGGTAVRVLGTLLSWMQDRRGSVFVAATANRIDALPPELLRRGRFDEIFFVDLPSPRARAEILGIHLARRGRDPAKLDVDGLAQLTEGFSGAELEQLVIEALFAAYEAGRDLTDTDLVAAVEELTPLSAALGANIRELRAWAATRARPAE